MEFEVTHDRTKRSVQLKITDGPVFDPHDQWYRRRQVEGRADTLMIIASVEMVLVALESPIKIESVKLLGPQLKADKSPSGTLRCSATWSDQNHQGHKIDDIPAWLWKAVRDAVTGSTEWTAEDPS